MIFSIFIYWNCLFLRISYFKWIKGKKLFKNKLKNKCTDY